MLSNVQVNREETIFPFRESGFLRVVYASIVMTLQMYKRYKANLIGSVIEMILLSLVFLLFSTSLEFTGNAPRLTIHQTFIFYLGALSIISFNSTALWTPLNTVNRDLMNGTLEYLFFCPNSRFAYFLGSVLGDGIIKFIFMFLPSVTLLFIIAEVQVETMLIILFAATVILTTLMSFGIMISLSGIMWKQVAALAGIIGLLFQFLAGAFFPMQAFPEPIRWFAYLLPYTFGFDIVRYYAFEGNWETVLPIELEWIILLFYAVLYLSISLLLLGKVEKYAKRKGLHLL